MGGALIIVTPDGARAAGDQPFDRCIARLKPAIAAMVEAYGKTVACDCLLSAFVTLGLSEFPPEHVAGVLTKSASQIPDLIKAHKAAIADTRL